ncbi:MAG: DUF2798 domain-containing protein [Rhodobacteraceae bacterium]|nr:DUF2798 domain-containing protein [Paracoccaceae bacterium]
MISSDVLQKLSGAVVMSGFMSVALSGVFTGLEFGLTLNWLAHWGQSILIAWPVAIALDLSFGSNLRRISGALAASFSRQ